MDGLQNDRFTKEDSYKNLERVNQWISNVDAKTSIALAFVTLFVAVIFTSDFMKYGVKQMIMFISDLSLSDYRGIIVFLSIITISLLIYFLCKASISLLNAISSNIFIKYEDGDLIKHSILFFGSIISNSFDEYYSKLEDISEEKLLKDIASQTYINSKICDVKFRNYNKAIENLKYSIILFILVIISFTILAILE